MYLPNRKIHISKYIYMEIDLHILCVSHSLIAWIMHDLRLDDHAWTSSALSSMQLCYHVV